MNQNKIESICAALIHYDGCEFDLRLTKDNVLILFHDAWYYQRRIIETNFKDLKNIQITFKQLIHDPEVEELVNDGNKTLWIEAKEERNQKKKSTELYNKQIADEIQTQLNKSRLNLENIYIISFNASILKNLKDINKLLIVPYYDCSSDGKLARKQKISFKKLLVYLRMFRSIKHHIQKAKELGLNGLLFPKQYFRGFFSIFQPSLENILTFAGEDVILGTDADTFEEEQYFKDLVVITNYNGKRSSNYRKKPLIFHGGLEMENAERMAPSA